MYKNMIETNVFKTRTDMLEVLKSNPGVIIVKYGAEWCGPCKKIEEFVKKNMELMPTEKVRTIVIDIDDAIDAYAFLKSKKIVNGIPVILAYYKGNASYIPDDVVIGTNTDEIKAFFDSCYEEAKN